MNDANIEEDRFVHVKLSSPSDQTKTLYKWEEKRFVGCDKGDLSLVQCQDFVNQVWDDLELNTGTSPKVVDGRGSNCARAWLDKIALPKWSRNLTVLIHELAHCVAGRIDQQDNLQHGGIYVHTYLTLLSRYGNHKYHELLKQAMENGIRVTRIKLRSRLKPHCFAN